MGSEVKRICCIGAGYVGATTCAVLALKARNVRVTVVDTNQTRIDAWNSGHLPIYEPGLDDIVSLTRDGDIGRPPNLFFSTDVASAIRSAEVIFIAVNTPTKTSGVGVGQACDLAFVESAARQIVEISDSDKIVVEKSTVPCGTAERLRSIFTDLGKPGVHLEVLSNPEFLSEGTAVLDLLRPDRVLLGSQRTETGADAVQILSDIYELWVAPERIININVASSEMAKLAANCMLAQRVSSINSLSALCETEGAVIDEIAYAIGLDDRIGPRFLRPSVGFGGSCFRKDVLSLVYLAESRNLPEVAAYWKAVIDINDYQQARFSRKIISALNNTLANKSVAVLGFAYKKNTSDTRNSPAIDVVKQLLDENANVRIYDPKVEEIQIRGDLGLSHPSETANQRLKVCNNTHDACNGVAAIIILTEWDLFRTDKVLLSTRRGTHLASNGVRQDVLSHERVKDHAIMNVNGIGRCNGGHLSESANSTDSEEYDARPQPGRKGVCSRLEQRIDWKHISSIVQRPRLVFDGRNIVCPSVLEDLGFRVHNIGNAGC